MGAEAHDEGPALRALGAAARHTIADDPLATIRPDIDAYDTSERDAYASLIANLKKDAGGPHYARFGGTLGQGAMGLVRAAVQPRLEREVAVKVLRDDHRDDASTLRLLQEAWVTGILEHPNIVPVHEIAVDPDGFPQVVLKHIRGRRWNDLMHDANLLEANVDTQDSFEWNLGTLMTVCDAIEHAHRRGIVHRDIKPENVMIGEYGEVYVVDWGIAVSTRDEDRRRIQLAQDVKEMSGTPGYMAPEQVQPVHPISVLTDVYLLGSTLYEIIAGEAPHSGEDLKALVRNVLKSDPTYPTEAPPELVQIAQKAMAPDPEDRFESAQAFKTAIQRFLDGRGSARICYRASMRLTELEGVLEDSTQTRAHRRAKIYDLWGACRFGFMQALEERPDNPVAKDGLERATTIVARFELEDGNVDVAERLALGMGESGEALQTEIRRARRKKHRRDEELEALRRDRDPRVGQRARATLAAILGVVFTVAPLAPYIVGVSGKERLLSTVFGTALFLAGGGMLALWKREEMTASALNRGLLGTIFLTLLAGILTDVLIFLAGADPWIASSMRFFLWMIVTAMVSIALDTKLWPSSVGYTLGFVVSVLWPGAVFPMMSIANLTFLVNALWAWWPRERGRARGDSVVPQ